MARPARPQLSTRVRVCLRIELVVWTLMLVNIFIPYFFDDLRLYLLRFTDIWFYEWVVIYSVLIVLAAIALAGRNIVIRYVLVCVVLVSFLLIDPVLSVVQGGEWYGLFMPPTLDPSVFGDQWYAPLLVVRGVLIWLIVRTGIVTAIVLAVPGRRTPAAAPVGGPFVAAPLQGGYPASGGAVPPLGVNPVAPRRESRCSSGHVARCRHPAGSRRRARAGDPAAWRGGSRSLARVGITLSSRAGLIWRTDERRPGPRPPR